MCVRWVERVLLRCYVGCVDPPWCFCRQVLWSIREVDILHVISIRGTLEIVTLLLNYFMSRFSRFGLFVLVLALLGAGAFFYITRPVKAPSADVPSKDATHAPAGTTRYAVTPGDSGAEFNVWEVLRGKDFLVVGKTTNVHGDIFLNRETPSASTMGTIRVNARALKTDSPQRDGAIARLILRSENDANEWMTFAPTALSGMPAVIVEGQTFNFSATGNLTIAGVTRSATFHGSVTLTDAATLTGHAETTVQYKDFGLTIPNVPFVARVDENVALKVNLVARAETKAAAMTTITEQEAVERVKKQKAVVAWLANFNGTGLVSLETGGKAVVEADHEEDDAYVVHVYEVLRDHTATQGWYRVNKKTGIVTSETP